MRARRGANDNAIFVYARDGGAKSETGARWLVFFSMLTSEFLINIRDRAAFETILKVKFDLLFIYTYTHIYKLLQTNVLRFLFFQILYAVVKFVLDHPVLIYIRVYFSAHAQ